MQTNKKANKQTNKYKQKKNKQTNNKEENQSDQLPDPVKESPKSSLILATTGAQFLIDFCWNGCITVVVKNEWTFLLCNLVKVLYINHQLIINYQFKKIIFFTGIQKQSINFKLIFLYFSFFFQIARVFPTTFKYQQQIQREQESSETNKYPVIKSLQCEWTSTAIE